MKVEQYYSPSDSIEMFDTETEIYYNSNGDPLRGPDEYDDCSEGYTPFGDE